MARLWSCGFELNSLTLGMEFTTTANSPTIQSAIVRSGAYAGRAVTATTTIVRFQNTFSGPNTTGPIYLRDYVYFSALPAAACSFMAFYTSGNLFMAGIELTTTGTLQLRDEDGTIGSTVGVSTGTWYMLEIKLDATAAAGSHIVEARIDGVVFATSSTRSLSSGVSQIWVGTNLQGASVGSGASFYHDDIAINDATGSSQTSYPGSGKIIHLRPNTAGDANTFASPVGGTSGAANNYGRVNEITPDDATTYNQATAVNQEDMFRCNSSGLRSADVVTLVQVGIRLTDSTSSSTTGVQAQIKKVASGTIASGAAIVPNSTTWTTHAAVSPKNYSLTAYKDPDSTPWTNFTLNTMQIGYKETSFLTNHIRVSNVWALVEYIPSASPPISFNNYQFVTGGDGMSFSERIR